MSIDAIMFERFATLFGKPNTPNPAGFLDEYRREFGGIDPDLLQATVNAVIRSHVYPTWPTIGGIHRELKHQAEHFQFRQSLKALPAPKRVPHSDASKARVAKILRDMKRGFSVKTGEAA